ncbi:hypothetical protein K1719_005641 [Acacia pycnantha]|nr:hypothetical protein K1719_005641 [Acacia pycnantha]
MLREITEEAKSFAIAKKGLAVLFVHTPADVGRSVLRRFLNPSSNRTEKADGGKASKLAKMIIACLDVRANDKGDLVVTKGDRYDVRKQTKQKEVRNLGKPIELARQYYKYGADKLSKHYWFPGLPSL